MCKFTVLASKAFCKVYLILLKSCWAVRFSLHDIMARLLDGQAGKPPKGICAHDHAHDANQEKIFAEKFC